MNITNPILPLDVFVPYVEAHVWDDGRIYLYGSFDIRGRRGYCSDRYHVYSSDDMVNWTDHGVSFSLGMTEWAKDLGALYAPDCAYRDGKYYLYYCVPDGRCGVAVCDSPTGPFKDIGPMEHVRGIDPAVMIDDDGQAWFYWGQFDNVRAAKLKDNMTEIDPDTAVQPLSVAGHEFHEGSSVKKINGRYYYLFTDTHRHGNRATCLGYAVSDRPDRGFEYGGIVIDNFGCDPKSWNDHGSLCQFKGQWYVFYHRSTHCGEFSRHVCAEPVYFDDNGRISELKMTSGVFKASDRIPACRAAEVGGGAYIGYEGDPVNGLSLTGITDKCSALFRSVDFSGEMRAFLRMRSDAACRAEIWIDGWYAGCVTIPQSGAYAGYAGKLESPVSGRHEVSLRFFGDGFKADLEDFTFAK
ncbi:MAG: family 43 glycosylhydrolase [Clostridiales bacterium]|nr:family 43 glycosylhydrolase [Clostridiales bacterium]